MPTETAIFAAGCFWGVEAEFRGLTGVTATRVGYCGGAAERPSYERVCKGSTGHAEAVELTFDSDAISYDALIERFWSMHNATTRNRQGWDIGSQYRSAIFTNGDRQQAAALASRDARQAHTRRKIVTEITPAERFWPAEEYHQQYLEKQGRTSCASTLEAA